MPGNWANCLSRATEACRAIASGIERSRLEKRLQYVFALLFWLGHIEAVLGADPYAIALDERFSNGAPAEVSDQGVQALEQGIKQQARQMCQPQESNGPPPPGDSGSLFLCLMVVGGGGVVLGAVLVLVLRRWNRLFDRPPAKFAADNVMAEDRAMVEFLRALHESVNTAAPGFVSPAPDAAHSIVEAKAETCRQPRTPPMAQQSLGPVVEQLRPLRKGFQTLNRAISDGERVRIMQGLLDQMELVKATAAEIHLHPIRLLASALQGLLKQLSIKAANMTPSALRTAAAAVDLLEILSTREVRPDVATEPPVRLLAVDDDPISRRVVSLALKKTFDEPDLAADGQRALTLAGERAYDLILLDVEMPGLDGFEACAKIHATALNRATPVVFVTSHNDFDSRARSALLGAHDLIGKPFLIFEITVKALTLILKGRLENNYGDQPSKESNQPEPQDDSKPAGFPLARSVAPSLPLPYQSAMSIHPTGGNSNRAGKTPNIEVDTTRFVSSSGPAPCETSATLREHLAPSVDEFAVAFFKATPAYLQLLREKFTSMRDPNRCDERQDILAEIFIGIHTIGSEAARAKLNAASRVCSALEAVLKRFMEPASSCSPSSFQSLVPALDTIEAICRFGTDLDVVNPPLRLLVVDDDAVARRTLSGALQLAVARPDSADCGEAALALAAERPYDLIFLDVIMPGMDGFAACTRLHELPLHRQTPVVFITSHDDTNSRAEAVASGGCGFIPKPVLPCEVLLLALTHGIRGRLERGKEVAVAPPVESVLAG